MTEFIDPIMRWVVAPLIGVVLWLLKKITNLDTEIRILDTKLEAQAKASKESHEALQATLGQVLARLDSIDRYLRKGGHE